MTSPRFSKITNCYKLGSTPKASEALSAASKAIEQAVANAIPSPQVLQTPKEAALRISSNKRVSFGPYVSPEIIDKVTYTLIVNSL